MALRLKPEHLEYLAPFFKGKDGVAGSAARPTLSTTADVVKEHFTAHSVLDHPCKPTLEKALSLLGGKPANIIETGSAAWGTKSTILLDSYVNSFGGSLRSVDIRLEPAYTLSRVCSARTTLYCDDSVNFLRGVAATAAQRIDFVYLDSWDVNIDDPLPSAVHGFNEFLVLLPVLRRYGGLLLVDDSPRDYGIWNKVQGSSSPRSFEEFFQTFGFIPGKGGLIKDFLVRHKVGTEIAHEYQLLWSF